jgi:hypothetical protein
MAALAGVATSLIGFVIYVATHEPPQKITVSKEQFIDMATKCISSSRPGECMDGIKRLYMIE